MRDVLRHAFPQLVATACTGALLLTGAVAAAADTESPSPEATEQPDLTGDSWDQAVIAYDPDDAIMRYDRDRFVEYLGDREADEDNVIVLETDILFEPNSWELPDSASAAIDELVADVPDGAVTEVTGHTDSRPVPESFDFDNQTLSERRADAVAEVLETERPDFDITVEGLGDSEPAETEDPEEPGTFAANRRVEIRYGDVPPS